MQLLTVEEAAPLVPAQPSTLETWRCKGRFPTLTANVEDGGCVVQRGRRVFYRRDLVEAWAAKSQAG